jgi:hypothetical protein
MERCKFKQGKFNCGSYAFNLYKEGIDQGDFCDHHYWQDQAMKARAGEREACAKAADDQWVRDPTVSGGEAIRARSNT